MTNIIDRGSQPISAYFNKIITVLVRKAGGELRISAIDMLETVEGEGFLKHYDVDKRELVLRSAPVGSELYFIRSGGESWVSALSTSERDQTLSAAQPRQLPPQKVILDDERLAQIELQRERDRLARQAEEVLLEFPEAPQTVRDYQRPQQPPSQQQRRVLDQFYRR